MKNIENKEFQPGIEDHAFTFDGVKFSAHVFYKRRNQNEAVVTIKKHGSTYFESVAKRLNGLIDGQIVWSCSVWPHDGLRVDGETPLIAAVKANALDMIRVSGIMKGNDDRPEPTRMPPPSDEGELFESPGKGMLFIGVFVVFGIFVATFLKACGAI